MTKSHQVQVPEVIRLEAHTIVKLPEYSTTLPTGVYPGKMWRAESTPGDPVLPGVEVPELKGKWIIGVYLPLDEKQCQLKWLPLEVVPYKGWSQSVTEHCHNEECLYLSLFGQNIDDVHHSPNCRGALLRRAMEAEQDRDTQAARVKELESEINRLNNLFLADLSLGGLTEAKAVEIEKEIVSKGNVRKVLLDLAKALVKVKTYETLQVPAMEGAIKSLISDRDSQAALVQKMKEFVKAVNKVWQPNLSREKLNEVLYNIGDNAADLFLELTPSTALQEFKERCWESAIEAAISSGWVNPSRATEARSSIVSELKRAER